MGYMTDGLTLNTLRAANINRLPEFKNKQGGLAHTKPDGSDWTVAQWLQAVVGELGEFCAVRIEYECGKLSTAEYEIAAGKELADILTYLDILALRALDSYEEPHGFMDTSPAQRLMDTLASLGEYANARKKYERGDYNRKQYLEAATPFLNGAAGKMEHLAARALHTEKDPDSYAPSIAGKGINLGRETIEKFNEVSQRVGSRVFIRDDGSDYVLDMNGADRVKRPAEYDPSQVKYEEGQGHD